MVRPLESIHFPTERQRDIAYRVVDELQQNPAVEAIAITASLGLGYGDAGSDLDMAVYAKTENLPSVQELCSAISERVNREEDYWIDADATDGNFKPGRMDWGDMDEFEKVIGNLLVYAVPVLDRNGMFAETLARWTPYYDEELALARERRFAHLATNHCVQGMKSVRRDFALDAMDCLHLGVQAFVASLFIARRVYPIDYLKRVDRHLAVLLNEPDLGGELRSLYDLGSLDPERMENSFRRLDELTRTVVGSEGPSPF